MKINKAKLFILILTGFFIHIFPEISQAAILDEKISEMSSYISRLIIPAVSGLGIVVGSAKWAMGDEDGVRWIGNSVKGGLAGIALQEVVFHLLF